MTTDCADVNSQHQSAPAGGWQSMDQVPRDGTLIDIEFDPLGAEPGMAEFYAPGCTSPSSVVQPVIRNAAFLNGGFVPVFTLRAARDVLAVHGGFAAVSGIGYGILSVTPTRWRPAVQPPRE